MPRLPSSPRLGRGTEEPSSASPGLVSEGVQNISLGSLYAGATTRDGGLLMWGGVLSLQKI